MCLCVVDTHTHTHIHTLDAHNRYIQAQLIKAMGHRLRRRKPREKVDPSKVTVCFARTEPFETDGADAAAAVAEEGGGGASANAAEDLVVSYIDKAKEWKCLYVVAFVRHMCVCIDDDSSY